VAKNRGGFDYLLVLAKKNLKFVGVLRGGGINPGKLSK
jgi:hypothetical protein